ncbi:hypothetical protein SAMN05216489_05442 [Streptomyces sp. 3213]|uniref:hypothetical protein n=1 Tax=Streptomyces sp. 3213.3 TaxID=1855348 RepID=UPI00089A15D7|nr:hypothetical protein [Streptomyces sp. 3213.3]SEE08185.1 hypothetical protein SAMN05216489_05442 [Streptomyces sp. 3213] [Streptomyces sp. 3213.3]
MQRGDAVRFARRHRAALLDRAVRLFSSGPLDASADKRDIPPVRGAGRGGDFRVFDRISSWATGIAQESAAEAP